MIRFLKAISHLAFLLVFSWGNGALGQTLPKYDHVVIVMEENHSFGNILPENDGACRYIKRLASSGALLTNSYAVTHPSLPNYLALFSGSTQGVSDDDSLCAYSFKGGQLAGSLLAAGYSFAGYSEGLPSRGSTVCNAGGKNGYYRKHNPWVYWQMSGELPSDINRPYKEFPKAGGFEKLPTVSFVIPNEAHDMHEPNGYRRAADMWLQSRLDAYARWARTQNSLLIVTWDEDDYNGENHIPTIFSGAQVKPGRYDRKVTHYDLLRTLEDMYGLAPLGESKTAAAITEVFSGK